MLPLRDCRGYRSRYINALNRAVRSLTPIAGRGIRLRQSAQGVVIEATAKSASGVPFDHRFKVSFAANADGGFDLTIRKGSLWRVAGGVAAEQTLLLGSGIAQHPTDADAWQVTGASTGALYVSQSTAEDGETPVYMLGYAAIPEAPLAVIAEFTPSQSSSNPAPKVTQRHLGDLLVFEGGEADTAALPPAAWQVRRAAFTEETPSGETVTTHKWQVFAPTWTVGRETLLPAGMGRAWNDLPDSLTSGTLYASLTWEGTATVDDEGNTTVSWTPGTPVLTNDASTIPPDDDPSGAGTSSATPGHRSVIVEIGEFSGGDDAFDQRHVGSIVEDVAEGGGGGGAVPVEEAPPASWEVRKIDGVWKIWSPSWSIGRGSLSVYLKDGGMAEKFQWNELGIDSGSVYAIADWDGKLVEKEDGTCSIFWVRCMRSPRIANSLDWEWLDSEPTRYEDGYKGYSVTIGRFEGEGDEKVFIQNHVGEIVDVSPVGGDYHEKAVLPVGFAITDEGQLEITTRNVNIPIAEKDNTEKILLDLPSGGGGGNGDTLGPIEWDATRNAYVQYIGKWTRSGSAWSFARKQQSGGSDYPPAAIYPVTVADLLIRGRGGSSGAALTDDIKMLRFKLPFAAATATPWLSKQETTVSNGVTYEPPEDAGGNGQLKTGTFTLTYWSDTTPGRSSNSTLLYTVVETANATSTYEG